MKNKKEEERRKKKEERRKKKEERRRRSSTLNSVTHTYIHTHTPHRLENLLLAGHVPETDDDGALESIAARVECPQVRHLDPVIRVKVGSHGALEV